MTGRAFATVDAVMCPACLCCCWPANRLGATGPDGIRWREPIIPTWSRPRDVYFGFSRFAATLLRLIVILSLRTSVFQLLLLSIALNVACLKPLAPALADNPAA
jgi:hypothetical protein